MHKLSIGRHPSMTIQEFVELLGVVYSVAGARGGCNRISFLPQSRRSWPGFVIACGTLALIRLSLYRDYLGSIQTQTQTHLLTLQERQVRGAIPDRYFGASPASR